MQAFLNILENLGKARDGLLVLITCTYLLGYCVWAYIAWRNGLPPLPLLDAQYLAAGLLPLLVVAVAIFFVRSLLHLALTAWPHWLAALPFYHRVAMLGVMYSATYIGFGLVILGLV
jgi:hypothetical protein